MAMRYSDPIGHDVLISKYSIICSSSLDPSDLARHLLQGGIVNQGAVDQVGSRTLVAQREKIGALLDAVLRCGAPKAFDTFLDAMRSDRSVDWLVDQLKAEYDQRRRPQVESDGSPLDPNPSFGFGFLARSTSSGNDTSSSYNYGVPSRPRIDPSLPGCDGRDNIADEILGEEDLVDVMEKVIDTANSWRHLGQALRLKAADLDSIASRHHGDDITECLRDTLLAWLQQRYSVEKYGLPTWKAMSKAVGSRAGANNPALAKILVKAHTLP